jgi:hypothetical protein
MYNEYGFQHKAVTEPPFGMDYRTWFELRAKLAKKRLEVMAGLETIEKTGYNEEEGYWFAKEADINNAFRKLLVTAGLGFDIEYVHHRTREKSPVTEVLLNITWTDVDTGYFEVKQWIGTGFDYNEKGIYKGYTGGSKYYLLRNFLASQGDTDPETSKQPKADKAETTLEVDKVKFSGDVIATVLTKVAESNEPKEVEPVITGDSITPEQVGQFKVHLLTLAAFNTKAGKKAANTAIFNSLFARPELQEWAKKIRTATHEKMIEALKTDEADTAIAYLVEWIGNKEKAKEAAAAKEPNETGAEANEGERTDS